LGGWVGGRAGVCLLSTCGGGSGWGWTSHHLDVQRREAHHHHHHHHPPNKPHQAVAAATAGLGPPPRLSRQLTKHVVTRWYRAPELILLQDYTQVRC
jgi:hypothetical protein